jgi:hypothetical protein
MSVLWRFPPIVRTADPPLDVRDPFTERREWFVTKADYIRAADKVQR